MASQVPENVCDSIDEVKASPYPKYDAIKIGFSYEDLKINNKIKTKNTKKQITEENRIRLAHSWFAVCAMPGPRVSDAAMHK